jgi:hypothetical protein
LSPKSATFRLRLFDPANPSHFAEKSRKTMAESLHGTAAHRQTQACASLIPHRRLA